MNRRQLLKASTGFAVLGLAVPKTAVADENFLQVIRGAASAADFGLRPGGGDQSATFSAMLERASAGNLPVFLPPGDYMLSGVRLPARVRLLGVPGATRLLQSGGGFFSGRDVEHLSFSGLVFDGAAGWFSDEARALLDIDGAAHLAIADCTFRNSASSSIKLRRAAGRIERTEIAQAADVGIYSIDAAGLDISGNRVADCGNGGILVHREEPGAGGTRVTGNRVARIRADDGGTGQHGNGINVYQAHEVTVTGNHVSDCAFSAIRSNGGSDVVITSNHCLRSGETALYSEFSFEGAVIGNNIVDGAANGIAVVNFDEGGRLATVTGNIVRNLSALGPYQARAPGFGCGIAIEADATASGNVIENAPAWGMQLGWGPFLRNIVATGNVIRRAGVGIAVSVVEGSGSAIITDNVIEAAKNGAIVGYRWAEAATGDIAEAEESGFSHLTVARNRAS